MTPTDVLENEIGTLADRLREERMAFAIATIVRTVGATSAKPGAKALVLADGTIKEGWVGGGCVRAAIARAAAAALRDGQPKFISIRPDEVLERDGIQPGETSEGVEFSRNGCPSKGSIDIFVEPVLVKPQLVILGSGPVAVALGDLSGMFDFDTSTHTDVSTVKSLPDGPRRFFIVASQGRKDAVLLRAAIESRSEFVAFVGSRLKFAALRKDLIAEGLEPAALDSVTAPAGVHIDAVTPNEIAVSILAQVIQQHRKGQRHQDTGDF